jgi:hypothetical protein
MRNWLSFLVFLLTLILGSLAFAYATIEYSGAMHNLTASVRGLPDRLQSLGLSNRYAVWADILLGGDKLIFLGFVIAARLFLTIAGVFVGFVLGVQAEDHLKRPRQPAPSRSRGRASTLNRHV